MIKVYEFLAACNYWRVFAIVFGIYFTIAGYSLGLFNSIAVAGFVFCLYQLGYNAALEDFVKQYNKDRE